MTNLTTISEKTLFYQEFLHRESNKSHHKYDQELEIYNLMKQGNTKCIDLAYSLFVSEMSGHLSNDPVTNYKFLFVASITLATRFSIEGGMEEETAYNLSDMYIRKMNLCSSVEEIFNLYREMFAFFTEKMANISKSNNNALFSAPVNACIDYIYHHLHKKIYISEIAEHLHLTPNYLSAIFKQQTKQTINEYILERRMEAAKNMLLYSDMSYADIAYMLSFNSQSYFTKVFHKSVGLTPDKFRKMNAQSDFETGRTSFLSSSENTSIVYQ